MVILNLCWCLYFVFTCAYCDAVFVVRFCAKTKNLFSGLGVDATVYELDQMGESTSPFTSRSNWMTKGAFAHAPLLPAPSSFLFPSSLAWCAHATGHRS